MNILIAIDSNYIEAAKVMLLSLAEHEAEHLDVFLLHCRLKCNEIKDMTEFIKLNCHGTLYEIYVNNDIFNGMPLGHQFTTEIYFRLLAPSLLPKHISRILWLDADTIVIKPINDFYYQNMNGKALAVVPDTGSSAETLCAYRHNLGLCGEGTYFNSGVILFDLDNIRSQGKIDLIKLMYEYADRLKMPDQDVLNIAYDANSLVSDSQYNYQIRYNAETSLDEIKQGAAIIHYIGKVKPWNPRYKNDVKWFWWKYYNQFGKKIKYYVFKYFKNPIMIIVEKIYKLIIKRKLIAR